MFYNDSLYVPDETKLLTGFNYEVEIPNNYYSPGYPITNGGDCRRRYNLLEDTAEIRIYVNNIYQLFRL